MTPEISERKFEDDIERGLLAGGPDARDGCASAVAEIAPAYGEGVPGGYLKRDCAADYDRAHCLLPGDVLDFLCATQPKAWERYRTQQGARPRSGSSLGSPGSWTGGAPSMCCARA